MSKIEFYKPKTIDGAVQILDSKPNVIAAGGLTRICQNQAKEFFDLGGGVVCLSDIPDLRLISRNERRVDFGAAVTLFEVENLKNSGHISRALIDAIKTVSSPAVRNFATLGGNLCSVGFNPTLAAPFLALDALLEFRRKKETIKISIAKFLECPEKFLPNQISSGQARSLLTKISVKASTWNVEKFHRFCEGEKTGNIVILIDSQKNVINDLRIAFLGSIVLRDKALESMKIGQSLPLSRKSISDFIDAAESKFCEAAEQQGVPVLAGEKEKFLNAIFYAMLNLTL